MDKDVAFYKAMTIHEENSMVFPQSKYPWTNKGAVVDMLLPCRSEDDYSLICELFRKPSF